MHRNGLSCDPGVALHFFCTVSSCLKVRGNGLGSTVLPIIPAGVCSLSAYLKISACFPPLRRNFLLTFIYNAK